MTILLRRLSRYSLTLLFCAALFSGGCAGQDAGSQPKAVERSIAAEDPFAEDDAYDYLTQTSPEGQTVVSDDYFADDAYLDDYSDKVTIRDPLEPWNRFWFKFNDIFIEYAARPVSKGYEFITPTVARKGIKNFFYNLRAPVRIINCLLQGEGQEAGVEFSTFFMNTIFGFGGTMDIAAQYKTVVPATGEDLGQTLGVWGVGEGLYLVWPFLGPSNLRDTVGTVGDYFIKYYTDPIEQFGDFDWTVNLGITAVETINKLDDILTAYDTIKGMAVDPYSAMRDGYTQMRRGDIME